MVFDRESYLDLLTFGEAPRQMLVELFGPLIGLEEEWRAQGASDRELTLEAFDFDYAIPVWCGGHTGPWRTPASEVLEETDSYILTRDGLGRVLKLIKGRATIPHPLEYPVKDMDTWVKVKPYFVHSEERIDRDAIQRAIQSRNKGCIVVAGIPGGFDVPRELMGEAECCLAYYEQPELIYDIMNTITDTATRVLEAVSSVVTVDILSVHEDMAGKSGPLIGPKQLDEFVIPYYSRVSDMLFDRGCRIFQQDSDGNIEPIIATFAQGGVNCFFPMEPAAGMDIVAHRRTHGKANATLGGIDKHILRDGNEAIRRELEYKLQPMMQKGGAVFGLDHRIPNGTPLSAYRYYVDTAREMLGLPPRDAEKGSWRRMAF